MKTICEKAKRIFKASESIWLWFVILKFTYKLKLSLSMKLSLSCQALHWSAPGDDFFSDRGVVDATTLARLFFSFFPLVKRFLFFRAQHGIRGSDV